jgi:hypothetical protein
MESFFKIICYNYHPLFLLLHFPLISTKTEENRKFSIYEMLVHMMNKTELKDSIEDQPFSKQYY